MEEIAMAEITGTYKWDAKLGKDNLDFHIDNGNFLPFICFHAEGAHSAGHLFLLILLWTLYKGWHTVLEWP